MNDDKERKDTCKEINSNGGNQGVKDSSGSSQPHPFSSMGPNHNHQYHGHHRNQPDSPSKAGSSSGSSSSNCHSNGGAGNAGHLNSSANGSSNVNSASSSSSASNNFSSEVCRDFLRNVCRRGGNCRYRHPEGSEAEELGKKVDLIFCHDYQNKECRRSNCRFIHCTKQEEEIYRATGKLPSHLVDKLSYSRMTASPSPSSFHHSHQSGHHHQRDDYMKSVDCDNSTHANGITSNSSMASNLTSSFASTFAASLSSPLSSSSIASPSTLTSPFSSSSVPVCKDNLKGDCLRGPRCKFRHISQAEYDLESRGTPVHSLGGGRSSSMDRSSYHLNNNPSSLMDCPTSYQGGLTPPEPKRRAYDTSLGFGSQTSYAQRSSSSLNHHSALLSTSADFDFPKPPPPSQSIYNTNRLLEDENFTLRRHIDELKKQVAELMASNEFLLEENAQLRTIGSKSISNSLHSNSSQNDSYIGSREHNFYHSQHQHHHPAAFANNLSGQSTGGMSNSPMASLSSNSMRDSPNPLVSYPLMTNSVQSLRSPTLPHSLSH